jgi:hypothetical protein
MRLIQVTMVCTAVTIGGCGVSISRLIPQDQDETELVLPDASADGSEAIETGEGADVPDGVSDDGDGVFNPRPGIQIGHLWVPRQSAVVFIHIGHSNMAGRAANPAELKPYFHEPHAQLWSYRATDTITATGPLLFRPTIEPLAEDSSTQGRAGPGMALLRSALARAPKAQVISIGAGQSGAQYGLCESYKKGGLFYDYFMRPARALRGKVTFAALLTMFGANEFWGADPNASELSDCLKQIASDVRVDLGQPDLPVLIGDYEMTAHGQYLPSLPGPAAVISQLRLAIEKICRR